MYDLKINDNNEFTVRIPGTNITITIYYRTILSSDVIEFRSKSFQLIGKNQNEEATKKQMRFQFDFGAEFITGFKEGDLSYDGKLISSDPNSPNYKSDWKELLKETATFVVERFVDMAFGYGILEQSSHPFEMK